MSEKAVAVLTLRGAPDWTNKGRHDLAEWLRDQAKALESSGYNYDEQYRARYFARRAGA